MDKDSRESQRRETDRADTPRTLEQLPFTTPPKILEAQAQFLKDLHFLLPTRQGEWVAYRGPYIVGFSTSKTTLVQECLREGMKHEEFLVRCIEPQPQVHVIGLQ